MHGVRSTTSVPLLQVGDLSKSFSGIPALLRVNLEVVAGELHAVLGENGAGKSTLMKMLAGLEQPDAGTLRFEGRLVRIPDPHAARRLGIAMIHQELMPFPELSVAENVFMGRQPTTRTPGWIDRARMHDAARRLLERLKVRCDPAQRMGKLSVAAMQAVEIARAIAEEARLIIMDEPTSALSGREADALFEVIAGLRRSGVAIIYISHNLDEVLRLADRITVLRDGRCVATGPVSSFDADRLIGLMVGRAVATSAVRAPFRPGPVVLSVRGLSRRGAFADVNFDLRAGEVLGLAGLMGAGRTALVSAIYGLEPADGGQIAVLGRDRLIANPGAALASRIAMVTEDRKTSGLVPTMSIRHNLTLASLKRFCHGGCIDHPREKRTANAYIQDLGIKARSEAQEVRFLSGGNQQKVVLARALGTEPAILLLDEPTRGIDVGARAEIHALVARLAGAGTAILLVSSDLSEVLSLSHRLLVMREGRVVSEMDAHAVTPEEVLRQAIPA